MMVFLRFLVLVLMLQYFTLLVMGDSTTLNQQALDSEIVAYGNGVAAPDGTVVSFHKELVYGVPAAAAAADDVSKHKIGGRKMVVENVIRKEVKKNEEAAAAPKISGATYSVDGKCENEGKREYKLSGTRSLLPVKLNNGSGFIAFSADYHVPEPHPPKNN